MICPNCGFNIPEGYKFCPNCGNDIRGLEDAPQSVYMSQGSQTNQFSQPEWYQNSQVKPESAQGYVDPNAPRPGKVLALGIVALSLATVPIANIAAIIIAIICINKNNQINKNGIIVSKQARIGRNLAIAAIPVAIVFTFIWIIYVVAIVNYVNEYGTSSYSSYYYNYFR